MNTNLEVVDSGLLGPPLERSNVEHPRDAGYCLNLPIGQNWKIDLEYI